MRILIAVVVGVVIGYVTFSPDMEPTRKELMAKVNETIDGLKNTFT
jgi:uncharacterized membrane-anchored protein YhcB (DUF1043 family)